MAIDAGNFNGTAHFHLQPCVAMHVLHEVAIDAVHAFFNMDVHQMHGQAGAFVGVFGIAFLARFCEVGVVRFFGMTDLQVAHHLDSTLEVRSRDIGNRVAVVVDHVSFVIAAENGSENPAVAVEVGELSLTHLAVEIGEIGKELGVRPQAALAAFLRVGHAGANNLLSVLFRLAWRIHEIAIGLKVPPGVTQVAVHDCCARVNVTRHALAGGDGVAFGKAVLDRVPGLFLVDGWVWFDVVEDFIGRPTSVTEAAIRPRVNGTAVVGIDNVTCRATTGAIVAGLVVGAQEVESGVEKACFVQGNPDRVCAVFGTQTAVAEAFEERTAGIRKPVRDANFWPKFSASFKDPQNIGRLGNLEAERRIKVGKNALAFLVGSGWRVGLRSQWNATHGVELTVARFLVRHGPVVVERCSPKHAGVGHHALARLVDHLAMAIGGTAADMCHAQVARIHEANEIRRFTIEQRVGAGRVSGIAPRRWVSACWSCGAATRSPCWSCRSRSGCWVHNASVPAMAVGASQT